MAKKINKTSVADALKVIADALTADTTETKTEEKAPSRKFYAVYQTVNYLPSDYSGGYITDPEKLAVYYKLNPTHKPLARQFDLKTAGSPRYLVEVTKGNEELAKKTAEEAMAGLSLLAGNGDPKRTGVEYSYTVVTMMDGIV